MPRYDRGWGWMPPERRYDAEFRRFRSSYERERDWTDRSRSQPPERVASGEGIYGPARYGLGPYYGRLQQRRRPNDELREEVEEALFYDTWVDADAIVVEVSDAVVTLRGELPDYEEIRYATDDAWDVDGVRGVRCELTVRD